MSEYRIFIESMIRSRWEELTDPQVRVLSDHFIDLRDKLLLGTPTDRIIRDIDRFVHDFSTDWKSLEARLNARSKQN